MHRTFLVLVFATFAFAAEATAQEPLLTLPHPDTTGGKPLMQALKERHSSRTWVDRALPRQVFSNLLWAAFGINRPDGHRTAPSAMNCQEIDLYACMADGIFKFVPNGHALLKISPDDVRAKVGRRQPPTLAPLILIYVADMSREKMPAGEDRSTFVGVDGGCISQNIYLFCAQEGLSTVVQGGFDREAVQGFLKLTPDQKAILVQPVGYEK